MGVWLCGCAAVWLRGCVSVWPCGFYALCAHPAVAGRLLMFLSQMMGTRDLDFFVFVRTSVLQASLAMANISTNTGNDELIDI